jgi:Mn-dependent DtxR family transcriptional regulator
MTKDERFLIEIYRASQLSAHEGKEINPIPLAQKLGYKELLLKNILKGLRQANLIKIYGPEEIVLTERGIAVACSLLGS